MQGGTSPSTNNTEYAGKYVVRRTSLSASKGFCPADEGVYRNLQRHLRTIGPTWASILPPRRSENPSLVIQHALLNGSASLPQSCHPPLEGTADFPASGLSSQSQLTECNPKPPSLSHHPPTLYHCLQLLLHAFPLPTNTETVPAHAYKGWKPSLARHTLLTDPQCLVGGSDPISKADVVQWYSWYNYFFEALSLPTSTLYLLLSYFIYI